MLKVILTFLGLMILTSKAHAVTALVPVIAGFFGGGAIASLIVGLALSYIVGKIFAPEKEEREQPADQGVKQRIPTDPRNKLPVVYGTKSVAGQITYASISGNNQKMAFIISLAEGPVTSINTVKWEDKTLSFSGDINTGLRSVSNASPDAGGSDDFLNSGRFKVQVFPAGGRCSPMEGFDSDWNSDAGNRTMPNTAYAYCELTYDQEKRVTSLSNRLQFTLTGRTVKPLTSSTDATSYAAASEATSNNPAEILVDYLTNTRYGAGVPLSAIDFPTFFSHAQFCDENAQYTKTAADGGGTANATRYTTNGSINTNQDVDQNVTDLTIGNSAMLSWNYGQFGLISDKVKTSVFSFSEDNIFGKIQISKLGFDNKLNELTTKFDSLKSKEQEEQVIQIVPESNRNDNEPVLERTVSLPATNNAIEARRVSAIYLNKSRQDLMVNFTTSIEASGVESGDVISLTHETPGFTEKLFVVQSVEEKVINNIIGLEITAQEYADSVYNDTINDEDGAPNTRLPNPFASPVITGLTATEDTTVAEPNLVLSWSDDTDSPLVGQYEITYTPTVNTTEATTTTPADTTLTVSSTAGFPDSGSITIGNETIAYSSKTASVFNLDTAVGQVYSVQTVVTLSTKNFRTVSGGTRYEISPLIAQVSYFTEVTPVSTLGNRGATLTSIGTTGVARVIGQPGADGAAGVSGTSGLDGSFERAIYLNSNNAPDTPDAGNDFNNVTDTINAPEGWNNNATESDFIQRWVSRAIVDPNGEIVEESAIGFDTNATSGIKTLVQNGEKESGFFDVSGNPGTAVAQVFEETVITTNGITGSVVNNPAVAEINLMSLQLPTQVGTSVGSQSAQGDVTKITMSGTANRSAPIDKDFASGNSSANGIVVNRPSNAIGTYGGQAYANGVIVYTGHGGHINRSINGGLSQIGVVTSGNGLKDVKFGTSSGTEYFVAVGDGGRLLYSTNDGASWTENAQGSNDFVALSYSGGIWAAVGKSNTIRTTDDPTGTWSTRGHSGSSSNFFDIETGADSTGNAIFVAVGANGTIATQDVSSHTSTWNDRSVSGDTEQINAVTYSEEEGYWGACGQSASLYHTTNGDGTWIRTTTGGGDPDRLSGVAIGNGEILAVGGFASFRNGIRFATLTPTGTLSVTASQTPDTGSSFDVTQPAVIKFIRGTFYASGQSAQIYFGMSGLEFTDSGSSGGQAFSSGNVCTDYTYIPEVLDNTTGAGFAGWFGNTTSGTCDVSINGTQIANTSSQGAGRFTATQLRDNINNNGTLPSGFRMTLTTSGNLGMLHFFKEDGTAFTVTNSGSSYTIGASSDAPVGSCFYSQDSSGRYTTMTEDACSFLANQNGTTEFRRANRVSGARAIFSPRETIFDLDFDDTANGSDTLRGVFGNLYDGEQMARDMATQMNTAVASTDNNTTGFVARGVSEVVYSGSATGGTYTVSVDGTQASTFTVTSTLTPSELASALADAFSLSGFSANAGGDSLLVSNDNIEAGLTVTTSDGSGSSSTINTGVVSVTQTAQDTVANLLTVSIDNEDSSDPTGLYDSTYPFGDASGVVAQLQAGAAQVDNEKTKYRITAPSGHNMIEVTGEFNNALVPTDRDGDLAAAIAELRSRFANSELSNYTLGASNNAGDTTVFEVTTTIEPFTDESPNLEFVITDQGTFSDSTPITDITGSNTVTTEGVAEFNTGGRTRFTVTVNAATEAANVQFSEGADANTQAQEIETAIGTVSGHTVSRTDNVLTITSLSDGNKTDSTISYTFIADDDHTATEPVPSITDGVTGLTPDGITLDFKGSDDPASHSFTLGSNLTLDQLLTAILNEDQFIDGITLYDGNAFPTTTLATDIAQNEVRTSIEVTDASGLPESGTVTLANGGTFVYASKTHGSDLFGSCSVGTHTDRASCETEGVYTPHIRLNGTGGITAFQFAHSAGDTVTSNTRQFPGVNTGTSRRVGWEYDEVRSSGKIVILTITGTPFDGNVSLTIDGTGISAAVFSSDDELTATTRIRQEIFDTLAGNVTVVTGDVDNRIRLVGNINAGDYTVTVNDSKGLTISNDQFQSFDNETLGTGLVVNSGNAGGDLSISNFSVENLGLDEIVIGALTTGTVTINGVTYTLAYQGIEDNGGAFTPFEAADSQEIATQLSDFLNRQP